MGSNNADGESPPSMIPRRKALITTVGGLLATPLTTSNATAQQNDSTPSVQDIKSTLTLVEPDTAIEIEISATDGSTPDVVVARENTQVVDKIVFEDVLINDSVDITEYADVPTEAAEQVIESVTAGTNLAGGEGITPTVDTVYLSDITLDKNTLSITDTSATVTFSVPASEISNPEQLRVIKETHRETSWQQLETTVEEVGDEEVTISAQVDSFSLFVVTEIQQKKEPQPDESEADDSYLGLESLFISNNPLITAGAIVGPIFGYGIYRLVGKRQDETDQSTADSASTTTTDNDTQSTTEQSREDSTADVYQLQEQAIKSIERAERADYGDFDMAIDSCKEAITQIEQAIARSDSDSNQELKNMLTDAQATIETVTERREQRTKLIEVLKPAERSFQEAIVASIQNDQTVARIRFRQARDTFEEAHEILVESDEDLLTESVEISINPDRELSSTTLSELPAITETAATTLTEAGIGTVDNLDSSSESPWAPPDVAELADCEALSEDMVTVLTLLSWWDDDESYIFETAEAVARRQQQADYGFNQTA